ncbi:hypothetical protein KP509_16G046500 [Ceratopteris richardii]|nr:hypothetical protein KP509_16G046500 [Ceratopteris richardii]
MCTMQKTMIRFLYLSPRKSPLCASCSWINRLWRSSTFTLHSLCSFLL